MAGRPAVWLGNEEYAWFASGGRSAEQVTMLTASVFLRLLAALHGTQDYRTPRAYVGLASSSLAQGLTALDRFCSQTSTPKERGS